MCYHRAMLGFQQTGNFARWREASQHAVEGFERVDQATSGDPASRQDLVNVLTHACDGYFVFSDQPPADLSLPLAWAQKLVALSDVADPTRLQTLATYQFLSGDVPGAVASIEKALAAVTDGPEATEVRAKLNQQLEEYRQALPSPAFAAQQPASRLTAAECSPVGRTSKSALLPNALP